MMKKKRTMKWATQKLGQKSLLLLLPAMQVARG